MEETKTGDLAGVTPDFSKFIGDSLSMQGVYETITQVLDNDSTVLILGESGVGKEVVANAIHENSLFRNENPMVTVNCAAIPEELLESELFGHEKGSFTGAIRTRIGKFELADKGTIFLDEIGDMSPNLQVKLLRILQERCFERVGGTKVININLRVIAATNQNLEKAIEERRFREDLYYRLNVIPIEVPGLRERGDDITQLIGHFIKKFNKEKNRRVSGVSPEALAMLKSYRWPGNVRELEHMMERLVILKRDGVVQVKDLPPKVRSSKPTDDGQLLSDMLLVGNPDDLVETGVSGLELPVVETAVRSVESHEKFSDEIPANGTNGNGAATEVLPGAFKVVLPEDGLNLKEEVDQFETKLILEAMRRCNGVKNKAAALLGLNRTTLVEKLKKKKLTSYLATGKEEEALRA